MKTYPECRPCLVRQLSAYAERFLPPAQADALLERYRGLADALVEKDNPPDQAAPLYERWVEETGITDPLQKEKDISTAFALRLLPRLREEIAAAPDEFAAMVRLIASGNIMDYGADHSFTMEKAAAHLKDVFSAPADDDAIRRLRREMDAAKRILYIADNCGEAVFDRLLIERYADKTTLGVRGKPILNDLTRREVAASQLDFVPVIDTGDMTPGVSLRRSSPEFIAAVRTSDLVIAKGQGNFETLDWCETPMFYLLTIKCPVIGRHVGLPCGSLMIRGRNLKD